MKPSISTISLYIIGLLIGSFISYGIAIQIFSNQLSSNMEDEIGNLNLKFANLESELTNLTKMKESIETLQTQLESINKTISQNMREKNNGYMNQTEDTTKADRFDWLTNLLYDLQLDTTDSNPKNNYSYDDEHYARDLEDNLESIGYNVSCIIAFYMVNNELNWDVLVKITRQDGYFVFVNPQTDAIVTDKYDGDKNGITETIRNPSISGASSLMLNLVNTSIGNDGKYLLFEFDDYETVKLVDTRVYKTYEDLMKDLEEDKTDQKEYINDTHDCDDFARELEDALEARGYRVTIKLVYWRDEKGEFVGHAINDVYLDGGRIVTIEPQNDRDVTGDYDGNGNGIVDTVWGLGLIEGNARIWLFKHFGYGATDEDFLILEYEDMDDIPLALD
ncbi:MAG TPA: hypothetical protein ENI44_02150 [Thermoplasmatales archaeon]|nr:hypothetical protein [Thermoplasmatales archaeon]